MVVLARQSQVNYISRVETARTSRLIKITTNLHRSLYQSANRLRLFKQSTQGLSTPRRRVRIVMPIRVRMPLLTIHTLSFLSMLNRDATRVGAGQDSTIIMTIMRNSNLNLTRAGNRNNGTTNMLMRLRGGLLPRANLATYLAPLGKARRDGGVGQPRPCQPSHEKTHNPREEYTLPQARNRSTDDAHHNHSQS